MQAAERRVPSLVPASFPALLTQAQHGPIVLSSLPAAPPFWESVCWSGCLPLTLSLWIPSYFHSYSKSQTRKSLSNSALSSRRNERKKQGT